VTDVYRKLAGRALRARDWPEALYADLAANEIAFQLSELLAEPCSLADIPGLLESRIGRTITEAEILTWLTLGAAARHEGRPLLRPVVHGFVRGVSGAVVSFPEDDVPVLWLAAEDEIEESGGDTHTCRS